MYGKKTIINLNKVRNLKTLYKNKGKCLAFSTNIQYSTNIHSVMIKIQRFKYYNMVNNPRPTTPTFNKYNMFAV